MKDEERDLMRKIILELVQKGHIHWTDLKKKVLGSCHSFATDATFSSQMRYLLRKGFIRREARGIYRITSAGEKYVNLL